VLLSTHLWILSLWFRASLIYINNCPTRCDTKQSIYYSASSPYTNLTVVTVLCINNCPTRCDTKQSIYYSASSPYTNLTVVTVLCTPDDGCGWHSKHVEWTCRIINRLLWVASRWTVININKFMFCKHVLKSAPLSNVVKVPSAVREFLQSHGQASGRIFTTSLLKDRK